MGCFKLKDFNDEMQRDHSRKFNVHAWSEHKAVKKLVNKIFNSFTIDDQEMLVPTSNNKGKSDSLKQLRTTLADLYVGWKTDPTLCTGISRNNNDYKPKSRYNALHIPKKITKVFDVLCEYKYLDIIKGAYNPEKPWLSRTTRYRPTELLQSLFNEITISQYEINLRYKEECIILRDKDPDEQKEKKAKDIEYIDTPETCSMRLEVQAYNKLMLEHYVDLPTLQVPYIIREEKTKFGHPSQKLYPVDQLHKFTRRIFSRNSWELNGRWNGGFWQNLPKHMRRDIFIDNEPTDEIDYSGLHPSILALENGFRLTGDRYDMERQVSSNIPLTHQREIIKKLALICINAKTKQKAFKAFHNKHSGYKNDDLEVLLDAFVAKHPYLESSLCSDQGIRLMNIDSKITTHIINQFVALDIPILSIHDSYIVKFKDTGLLRSAMSVACIEVLGADIEAEARTKKDLEYLKYATTWRSMDRDFYLDTFKHLTHFEKCIEYGDRYKEWKKWKGI